MERINVKKEKFVAQDSNDEIPKELTNKMMVRKKSGKKEKGKEVERVASA